MRDKWKIGIFALLMTPLFYYGNKYYHQIEILNGYAARTACSCTFIAHRPLEKILAEDLSMNPMNLAQVEIDSARMVAYASLWGFKKRKAAYNKDLGCVLIEENGSDFHWHEHVDSTYTDKYEFHFSKRNKMTEVEKNEIEQLVFDPQKSITHKKTRALLVLHNDSLIMESYAIGVDQSTPLLGWSMTKSITNALIGILVKQNKIWLDDKSLFSYWKDARANISVNELLQMRSGIEWEEDYANVSDATTMLFSTSSIPDFVGCHPLGKKQWYYSSGTTNLLSAVIESKFATRKEYHDFPYSALFDPLGMHSAVMETDEAGYFISSSYMYASARDWMRFGRLFLHDGVWQGRRLLPEGWVQYTNEEAKGSNGKYGAHFWLNKRGVAFKDCPHDLYYADGFQGQYIVILPGKNLVIVRLGLDDIDMNSVIKKIIDVIDS